MKLYHGPQQASQANFNKLSQLGLTDYDLIEAISDNKCLFNVFALILLDIGCERPIMKNRIVDFLNIQDLSLFRKDDSNFTLSYPIESQQAITTRLQQNFKVYMANQLADLSTNNAKTTLSIIRFNFDGLAHLDDQAVKSAYLNRIDDAFWFGMETTPYLQDMLLKYGIFFNDATNDPEAFNELAIITDQMNLTGSDSLYGIINANGAHFDCLKRK